MSNIIKGGRIRSQGIINLSERVPYEVEYIHSPFDTSSEIMPEELMEEAPLEDAASLDERQKMIEALEQEAMEKVAKANEEAEAIIAQALAKAKQIKEDAKQEETDLIAQAYGQKDEIISVFTREAEHIRVAAVAEKEALLAGVEGEVVETMITLLSHIVSEELTYHTDWLKFVVRKMLHNEDLGEEIVLCISPLLLERLKGEETQLLSSLKNVVAIKEDEALSETACRLVTSEGNIEYDVSEGLEKVIAQLRIIKGLA